LRNVTPGVHMLTVRRMGFAPQFVGVDVLAEDEWKLTLVLSQTPTLEPVKITAEASGLKSLGFNRRRQAFGQATFLTSDDLWQMNAKRMTDVFTMFNWLWIYERSTIVQPEVIVPAGPIPPNCIQWIIDKRAGPTVFEQWTSDWINDIYLADSIGAIEVYPRGTPLPYDIASMYYNDRHAAEGRPDCAFHVLWTKTYIDQWERDALRRGRKSTRR
jgi:hypothetical protein